MTKHSVQNLRYRAQFFKVESLKDIAEAMPLMMTGNPASAPLMRSAGAQAIMAGMCNDLADEIEAHAETRKRLLRLQYRMRINADGYPIGLAQLAVLTFWGRNTKEDINAARTNRKALHLAGRGVPR